MIICDFETSGLITNESLPLAQQPSIIEIGVIKYDYSLGTLGEYSAFVKPSKLPLDPVITKVTGIKDSDLVDAKPFVAHLKELVRLFIGEWDFIAHNAPFDLSMLVFELRRLGKAERFPYCPNVIDTKTIYPGKLIDWAREIKGADMAQSHRALDDARLLRDCYLSHLNVGPGKTHP